MEPLVTSPLMTAPLMNTQSLMAPHVVPTIAISTLLALGMMVWAALKGWQGWLSLKERELDLHAQTRDTARDVMSDFGPATAARIELADLKERIRKLEAIASGVDL